MCISQQLVHKVRFNVLTIDQQASSLATDGIGLTVPFNGFGCVFSHQKVLANLVQLPSNSAIDTNNSSAKDPGV